MRPVHLIRIHQSTLGPRDRGIRMRMVPGVVAARSVRSAGLCLLSHAAHTHRLLGYPM